MKKAMNKIMMVLMSVVVFLIILSPEKVYAHNSFYLQVLVNENSYEYQLNVIKEDVGRFSNECKHLELKHMDYGLIADNKTYPTVKSEFDSKEAVAMDCVIQGNSSTSPNLYFGFSPEKKTGLLGNIKNHSTKHDFDRAMLVGNTLIPALNQAMIAIYENNATSEQELFKRSKELGEAIKLVSKGSTATVNGATLKRGKIKPYEKGFDSKTGLTNQDWVVVTKNGQSFEFPYQIIKGYNLAGTGNGFENSKLVNGESYKADNVYLTWNMLMLQGNFNLSVHELSSSLSSQVNGSGMLESHMVSLFESTLMSLTSLLGLYQLEELIFNEGARDYMFHYGAFSLNWESLMNTFYWIFQAIAWSLLMFSFYKLLIQRNLSVMNPRMRVSLKEGFQDLLITFFILVFIYPLINFLLVMNFSLVQVFKGIGVNFNSLSSIDNYGGSFGGMLLQFYYFFINLWLNFTYIIRGIIIAILMVMAPVFVASIAFSGKWKGIFGVFITELVANIFMQSFHAFVITFLFAVSAGTRGIETAVTLFALILLTELFRSMFFGNAGGLAGKIGLSSVAVGAGLLSGAAVSAKKNKKGKKSEHKGEGGTGGDDYASLETSSHGGMTNETSMKTTAMTGGMSTLSKKPNVNSVGDGGTLNAFTKGSINESGAELKSRGGSNSADSMKFGMKNAGLGAFALGAGSVGAGYAMAFGSMNPNAGAVVGNALTSGASGNSKTFSEKPSVSNSVGNHNSDDAIEGGSVNDWNNEMPQMVGYMSHSYNAETDSIEANQDANALSEQGIMHAKTFSGGSTQYIYDESKLNEKDAKNVKRIREAYMNGNKEDRTHLKEQGIENVYSNKNGETVITYNNAGNEKLGIQNVRTNAGKMSRSFNANQSFQPQHTYEIDEQVKSNQEK